MTYFIGTEKHLIIISLKDESAYCLQLTNRKIREII